MAVSDLNLLFRTCLHRRIDGNQFCRLLKQLIINTTITSKAIVSNFLNCSVSFCLEGDPLIPQYLQNLISHDFIRPSELMSALILQWNGTRNSTLIERTEKTVSIHTTMISNLNLINSTTPINDADARRCILLSSQWLSALTKWTTGDGVKENRIDTTNLAESIGFLLLSFLNTASRTMTGKIVHTSVQQALDQCMTTFPNVSMQLMAKMSTIPKPVVFQTQPSNAPSPHTMNMAALEFEGQIHNAPIVPSRSATATYLNNLLRSGSTIDDTVLISLLDTRHQNNHTMMFNDLVFASIDAMIKSADSNNEIYQIQCQTFFLNKLPSVLAFIVTSAFESFSSESCLIDGWQYLSTSNNDSFIAVGKRCLQLCTLYHLITIETVTSLVGDDNVTSLKGLYAKDDLVNQVAANHSRGTRLVEELLKNDGNAGLISQAILEIMHNYCQRKELQNLKDMSNAIVKKPAAISAIGLFVKPAQFLTPLCSLLDDWKWDEIHGESQPVYDEFGSILLLILAFRQRLGISDSDLGIQESTGFLAKYIAGSHTEQDVSRQPEATQKHLDAWLKALYIDEGLTDELTTNCSAQDFYLLIPTLLRQSILAHSKGKLTKDLLKAGLDYLLEPFLLPSLLSAFKWIQYGCEKDSNSALIILQALTKQPESLEARDIHSTILSMAADGLEAYNFSNNAAIASIIASMKKTSPFTIQTPISTEDINIWKNTNGGVDALLARAIANSAGTTDTTYNATLLIGAIRVHGSQDVARVFVDLLIQFSGSHEFHLILDFLATIIASEGHSLRNAVQNLHSNMGKFLKAGDNLYAEAVVHLYRRVELYYTALTTQDLGLDHSFVPMVGLNVANINLDVVAPTFDQNNQVQNEDIDQVLNEAAALGGMDQVDSIGYDEMYGLSGGDLGLGNLDDLDLEMF